jgi:hypothetical protein
VSTSVIDWLYLQAAQFNKAEIKTYGRGTTLEIVYPDLLMKGKGEQQTLLLFADI